MTDEVDDEDVSVTTYWTVVGQAVACAEQAGRIRAMAGDLFMQGKDEIATFLRDALVTHLLIAAESHRREQARIGALLEIVA